MTMKAKTNTIGAFVKIDAGGQWHATIPTKGNRWIDMPGAALQKLEDRVRRQYTDDVSIDSDEATLEQAVGDLPIVRKSIEDKLAAGDEPGVASAQEDAQEVLDNFPWEDWEENSEDPADIQESREALQAFVDIEPGDFLELAQEGEEADVNVPSEDAEEVTVGDIKAEAMKEAGLTEEDLYPEIPETVLATLPPGTQVVQPGYPSDFMDGGASDIPLIVLPEGTFDDEVTDSELGVVAWVDGKFHPAGGSEEFLGGEGFDTIEHYIAGVEADEALIQEMIDDDFEDRTQKKAEEQDIVDSTEIPDDISAITGPEAGGSSLPADFDPSKTKPEDLTDAQLLEVLNIANVQANAAPSGIVEIFIMFGPFFQAAHDRGLTNNNELALTPPPESGRASGMELDRVEASLVASGGKTKRKLAAPVKPPAAWFENPNFQMGTPLTVTKEGRVFGHLALWGTCHAAFANASGDCIVVPGSNADYAMFHLGVVETAEGTEVPVGRLAMETTHADDTFSSRRAIAHYENTGLAIADIHAGEDEFGIWFSGALRPDATETQIRSLKASPLSGDWRYYPQTNDLELVMALAVNMPGFAVPRPKFMVASGAVRSLVAAGMLPPKQVPRAKVEAAKAGDQLAIDDIKYLQKLAARERAAEAKVLKQRALVASGVPDKIHALAKNLMKPQSVEEKK